jgi:hypothetical protein
MSSREASPMEVIFRYPDQKFVGIATRKAANSTIRVTCWLTASRRQVQTFLDGKCLNC